MGASVWAAWAAHQAAAAANETLEHTRRSEERQLRAYISIQGGDITLNEGAPIKIPFKLTNVGNIPAKDVRSRNFVIIRTPNDEIDENLPVEGIMTSTTIFPRDDTVVFCMSDFNIQPGTIKQILSEKLVIIVGLEVIYHDGFWPNRQTTGRFIIDARAISVGKLQHAPSGNRFI